MGLVCFRWSIVPIQVFTLKQRCHSRGPILCCNQSSQQTNNFNHVQDKPWVKNPLGRLRDSGAFNEVKMPLREGHNCHGCGVISLHGGRDGRPGLTLGVLLDPILVHALGQNNDSALNVPRDDNLSWGDS